MELIYSQGQPISADKSFADHFINLMGSSDYLQLATGYVSEDSLLFLFENIENKKDMKCDLIIGMHAYDGFTASQYNTAKELDKLLSKTNKGSVILCCAFPYHGKFYNFIHNERHFASITGSANLTQIIPTRQRNLTIKISEEVILSELHRHFNYLRDFCCPISEYNPKSFKESTTLLEDCIDVNKLTPPEIATFQQNRRNLSFALPLKPEKKSNLNISFGKGRENFQNGIIKPRSWFEFEVIVSKRTTSKRGYPRNKSFKIITEDGWMFECRTQGDYSKNLRSTGGLAILGMWLKGRMLDAGVVQAGEFIDDKILEKFGFNQLILTATNNPDIWLLELGRS